MMAALHSSRVASDAVAAAAAVAAACRVADDASVKAWAAEEAAEKALAAVKAQAHGGYPKATAAARGAAAMASRSTGQTAARPRSPLRAYEGLSLREHAVGAVAAAREAAAAAHESLKYMHIATEKAEQAAAAATEAADQAEAEWRPYGCLSVSHGQ